MFHPNYIAPSKLVTNADILKLFQLVEKHGGVLRFVGGAVRDAIAGFERSDIDLVTDMSPSEFSYAGHTVRRKSSPKHCAQNSAHPPPFISSSF